ncbi:MAG: hypothetical protein IJO31_05005 [Oscillospiraceae bacterium]|nr:hypothetical protein [Oscillospiraceae bacterium]
MERTSLKKAVGSIGMPEEMRGRILEKCKMKIVKNEEEKTMKNRKGFRWQAAMAAVLALCICLPIAGVAAGNSGFFRDVMRGTAVVGTEYVQATDEIAADAAYLNGELRITANFLIPDEFPYRECEELAVGSYRIMTGDGKNVAEGEKSENAAIRNGRAVMRLPVEELDSGDYTVRIDAFIGSKKAEQPLPLKGFWECSFAVE